MESASHQSFIRHIIGPITFLNSSSFQETIAFRNDKDYSIVLRNLPINVNLSINTLQKRPLDSHFQTAGVESKANIKVYFFDSFTFMILLSAQILVLIYIFNLCFRSYFDPKKFSYLQQRI